MTDRAPTRNARVAVAVGVALATAAYMVFAARRQPGWISDFDQLWFAARLLRGGGDPYTALGPGRQIDMLFPFYYPLTAVVIAWPLSYVDVIAARVIWFAIPVGVLCYLVTRENFARLPMFASGAMLQAALNAQWTPLLVCGFYAAPFAVVACGKPNLGAVVVTGRTDRRTAIFAAGGGLVVLLLSFALLPSWPLGWLRETRQAGHFAPHVLRPFGFLLLVAALRWRDPSARVLLALAVVPHNASMYETLWAFTATRTLRQSLVIAITTMLGLIWVNTQNPPEFADYVDLHARASFVTALLPMLWLILKRAPEASAAAYGEKSRLRATPIPPAANEARK